MKRINAGVRQYGRGNGIGKAIAFVLGPLLAVMAFLWWLGGLTFYR